MATMVVVVPLIGVIVRFNPNVRTVRRLGPTPAYPDPGASRPVPIPVCLDITRPWRNSNSTRNNLGWRRNGAYADAHIHAREAGWDRKQSYNRQRSSSKNSFESHEFFLTPLKNASEVPEVNH
jgi:hypothetical protein